MVLQAAEVACAKTWGQSKVWSMEGLGGSLRAGKPAWWGWITKSKCTRLRCSGSIWAQGEPLEAPWLEW